MNDADRPRPARRGRCALLGAGAVALGLGVGELVGGLGDTLRSPVEAVSEAIIDLVPGEVALAAIERLGDANTTALVIGVVVVAMLVGAVLGLFGARRPLMFVIGAAAFGVVGAVSAVTGFIPGVLAPVPSLAAGAVAAVTGWFLLGAIAHDPAREDTPPGPQLMRAGAGDRRQFLTLSGSVLGGAALLAAGGRGLGGLTAGPAPGSDIALPDPVDALAPIPDGADLGIDGVEPFLTPDDEFYRIDTALIVPRVPAEGWTLRLSGRVDSPLEFSYGDLLDRELVEMDITLTCVSNVVGGYLVGNGRWLGIPLSELLEEAGYDPEADQIVGRSVDGYTCGFPTEAAFDRPAMVAIGMNGEPLSATRGFPARLVVSGLYGYISATKWLNEIELTTFADFDQYWVPRGYADRAPIKPSTRIDVPRAGATIDAGETTIAGVAWAQPHGISAVEVRIDGGDWQEAELAEDVADDTWRQWRLDWEAEQGTHRITARCTDGRGEVQTEERTDPVPDGASGWMTSFVTVRS